MSEAGLPSRMAMSALGGMGAACFCHPFDVLRVQMQVDAGKAQGIFGTANNIVKTTGVKGLYNGLSAAFLRQWTYGACRVGIFSQLLSQAQKDGPVSFQTKLGIGCTSGAIGSFVGTPSELALVRMGADSKLPVDKQRHYKNVVDCCLRIAREEGVGALWTGSTPTIIRATLLSGATLSSYSEAKEKLPEIAPQIFATKEDPQTLVVANLIASCLATMVSSPFDVVKSRIQNMPRPAPGEAPMYNGMMHCFTQSIKADGPFVLFRGFVPAFVKLSPYNLISLTITDKLLQWYTGKSGL
mmetsp:Transcript_42080/g.51032  ORF Transcript_42080/g.51032 Transcript_42080/m.51032 type:complete len:298 (+) Transcript_42080:65-958(+)